MVKKTTSKTTKKKSSTVKKKAVPNKKVPAKKKPVKKKPASKAKAQSSASKTPFKSKLGHDPLAWITGDDASELGLSFDEVGSNDSIQVDSFDQITPATESVVNPVEQVSEKEPISTSGTAVNNDEKNQTWGLFEDNDVPPESVSTQAEEISDDGSWGLFEDEASSSDLLPVGEGVAWGLFEDEAAIDTVIEHDAVTIILPATFNVSEISKVFHEFEEIVNKNHDVIVDASEVETIDAVGLQLLYASHKELQKNDCKMVIKDASERVELLSKSTFINQVIGISG